MIYKAIGIMSGSALDGLDIVYVHFHETGGKWAWELQQAVTWDYTPEWKDRLQNAISLPALDYQLLHTDYGHHIGRQTNRFIDTHGLHHQVDLVASHGHTSFHLPARGMTGQLGDGAAIAAETGLPVVSDLRAMDIAFGGQGAPIVPIGEKLLLGGYPFFLNLGGIANISISPTAEGSGPMAFDTCPANRVLNMLVAPLGKEYDEDGRMAATGNIHQPLLNELNAQLYYSQPAPKSLANDFGTGVIYPLIKKYGLPVEDELRTYVEHIAVQVRNAIASHLSTAALSPEPVEGSKDQPSTSLQLLATGGGALNLFLMERIDAQLKELSVEVVVPDRKLINYKEALIMALIGVLRWREEYNVLAAVTGARRNTINGAVWLGNEA
jgi:anhydro-N-acetylmuramic acid kinase